MQNYKFTYNENEIDINLTYKYLGLTFSSNGSFLNARKMLAEQARKAMHSVLTKSQKLELPIDLQLKLFDHTVAPILLYASEIWGYEDHKILEKIHTEFLRKITKSKKSTPHYMLYGELGRFPISINIKSRMISFWNRLICSTNNKLSKQIYNFILNDTGHEYKWLLTLLLSIITREMA